jgi:hypothetical protein
VNFAGGAVVLIFTVERFNSAIHHREAHFSVLPLSPGWRNVSNLLRVNITTSFRFSYAPDGYFVGVLPEWFVVRLGEID